MTALVMVSPDGLSPLLQFLQDHGGDLGGRIGLLAELDSDHSPCSSSGTGSRPARLYILKTLSINRFTE